MEAEAPAWYVRRNPAELTYAFFISHVGDDVAAVRALKKAVERGRPELRCFLDAANWPKENKSSWVIKDALSKSEFMVVWITAAYLNNRRGWVWVELAYAELLELSQNFCQLDLRFPFIIPIFRHVRPQQIHRSPLHDYWQRSLVLPGERAAVPRIASELIKMYDRQARNRGPGKQK